MPPALPAKEKPPIRYNDRQGEKCLYHFNHQTNGAMLKGHVQLKVEI